MRGRRPDMQDTLAVFTNFRGSPYTSLLCCFDGHSGEKSAELAARRILCVVINRFEEKEKEVFGKTKKKPNDYLKEESHIIQVFTNVFRDIHGKITEKKLDDGTAALVALVEHHRLIVANAGDQRAILARGSKAVQITTYKQFSFCRR